MANVVEADDEARASGSATLRRPFVLGSAVLVAVIVLSLWSLIHKKPKASAAAGEPAAKMETLFVPNRQAVDKLEEQVAKAEVVRAEAAAAETRAANNVPTSKTQSVSPAALLANKAADKRLELVSDYQLKVLELELQMRLEAMSSGTRIKAVEQHRQNTLREAASLAQGAEFGGGGLSSERGADEDGMSALMGTAMAGLRAASAQGGGGGGGGGPAGGQLGAALRSLGQGGPPDQDTNKIADKQDFFKNGGEALQPGELPYEMRDPKTPYELQMGATIPCILLSKIVSAVPGMIRGRVTQNVFDSVTHQHLLIPQDTEAVGMYNVQVTAANSARLQIVWTRLNFPNGQKLDLGSMPGSDATGVGGIADQIDRHIAARFGAAVMASLLTVGVEMSAPQNGNFYGSAIQRGLGEGVLNFGTQLAQSLGNLPPTLTIRQGAPFVIDVNKDIGFKRPYGQGALGPRQGARP